MAKVKPIGVGFPQTYNETPSAATADLNPDHVVDLVTPAQARALRTPAKAKKVAKAKKSSKKR